jgi:hypothetical protein
MTSIMQRWGTLVALALTIVAGGIATQAAAQTAASAHTFATRYDVERRVVGTIAPDPDAGGVLKYAAVRNSYDAQGNLIRVEQGELAAWQAETIAPANWAGYTVFRWAAN